MNKELFIDALSERTTYSKEKCLKINNILEDNFLIGKKNKIKIVESFMEELSISEEDADKLYETCMDLLKDGLKEKIKHPFKDLDS